MFIRYKSNDRLYFYDKDENDEPIPISGNDGNLKFQKTWAYYFWVKEQNVYYFTLKENAGPYKENSKLYHRISEYNLNQEYTIEDEYVINDTVIKVKCNITFLSILQKAENDNYRYKNQSLYTFFEGPNIRPDSNDILFRDNYQDRENNKIYLSKYVEDYYPALAVSSPNFKLEEKEKKYYWDPGLNLGPDPNKQASNLYRAYQQKENEIPYTLFLKPNYRQWFSNRVFLGTPGTYKCKYNYNAQTLTIYNSSEKVIGEYKNVPHTITICCQGAGGGGGKGNTWSYAGWGGAGGGFIAANCFLGKNINNVNLVILTIQVGEGGKSGENGQSSYVQINQTVELPSFAGKENLTLAYYDSSYEYTKLENHLKIEGEGGGTEDRSKDTAGTGQIIADTTGWRKVQGGQETPGGEEGVKESSFLRSLFFKPLFCLKGGGGGQGGWGDSQESTNGKKAYFTSFNNLLTPSVSGLNKDVIMTWNADGSLLLKGGIEYSYNRDRSLDSALILGGPSLKEALDTKGFSPTIEDKIYVDFWDGGRRGQTSVFTEPGGGGGGSSLFGGGGWGGTKNRDNGYDGGLGAGGGGGKGGAKPGNGGKGGDGAVWLLW